MSILFSTFFYIFSIFCPGACPGSSPDPAGSDSEWGDSACAGLYRRHGPGYQYHVYEESHLFEEHTWKTDSERERTILYERDPARSCHSKEGRSAECLSACHLPFQFRHAHRRSQRVVCEGSRIFGKCLYHHYRISGWRVARTAAFKSSGIPGGTKSYGQRQYGACKLPYRAGGTFCTWRFFIG